MPSKKLPGANEIVEVLTPAKKDIVIQKAKASPFFETVLQTILASLSIDTLIISGGHN